MDYFDDPSRRPRHKQKQPRIYSQEELDGFRRAAVVARERWREELLLKGSPVYEKKRPRLRVRKKKANGHADERSKFAAAMARAELRKGYWSGEQEAQLRLANNREKPPHSKKRT